MYVMLQEGCCNKEVVVVDVLRMIKYPHNRAQNIPNTASTCHNVGGTLLFLYFKRKMYLFVVSIIGGLYCNTLIFIIMRKGAALLHMKFTAFNCFDYVIKMSDFGTKNHGFISKRNGSVSWLFCVFVLE